MPLPIRDDELAEIQRLYRELVALPFHRGAKRETPLYRDLIRRIRALVHVRTEKRGDEMIVVADACDENHRKD